MESNPIKVYVSVAADFDAEGRILPTRITWEDGHVYSIDRVTDVRQAAAMKAGSGGDRYTIRINGHESYLFFERACSLTERSLGRWFVERRQ